MNTSSLSLDQAPPLSVPMRFFLAAPLLGAGAGVLLLVEGGGVAVASRWSPPLLAMVHLVLAGFVVPVMFGALQQMLPVVAGSPVPKAGWVSRSVFALWMPGVLALAAALHLGSPGLAGAAAVLLLCGALAFLVATAASVVRAPAGGETVVAMRLSLASFAVAVGLGATLASGYAGWLPLLRVPLTNLHLGWALVGWIALLIIGVSYQVVPMFQMTPHYPAPLRRFLAPSLFALLLARSAATLAGLPLAERLSEAGLGAGLALFAIATLRLQAQRRRKLTDLTFTLFRVAMLALLGAVAAQLVGSPLSVESEVPSLLGALLFVLGFVVPVVVGMLHKIVPFLVWFHLQGRNTERMQAGKPPLKVPTMKDAIPARLASAQQWTLLAALPLALAVPFVPSTVARLAGAALALAFLVLLASLWTAWRTFLRHDRALR